MAIQISETDRRGRPISAVTIEPGTEKIVGFGSVMRVVSPDEVVVIQEDAAQWEGYQLKPEFKKEEINLANIKLEVGLRQKITGHTSQIRWIEDPAPAH